VGARDAVKAQAKGAEAERARAGGEAAAIDPAPALSATAFAPNAATKSRTRPASDVLT